MADDPISTSEITQINVAPGLSYVCLECTGPADYDATNGAALDLSSWFGTKIYSVSCMSGVDAKADALLKVDYVNDSYTDTDGGAVYFSSTLDGTSGEGEDPGFSNVADTTDLSGVVFRVVAFGY
jgi:hypothetical protein